jgi:hypothetical protein
MIPPAVRWCTGIAAAGLAAALVFSAVRPGARAPEGEAAAGGDRAVAAPDLLDPRFPRDVPIYAAATLLSQINAGDGIWQVRYRSPDPCASVFGFFRQGVRDLRWEVVRDEASPPIYALVGRKERRLMTVVVSPEENQSLINISLADTRG